MYKDLEKKKRTKREYYLAHCEEIKEKNKVYWKANREKLMGKAKEYRLAHLEKIKDQEKAYRLAHKEEYVKKNRIYQKEYYQKHKLERNQKSKMERASNKEMVDRYKALHPCILCGEKNTILLVFHHRDMAEKENGISVMTASSFPKHKIMKEIEKCEVLCFNCHALVHDRMRQCEANSTLFSLEEMIRAKTGQDIIPTPSLPLAVAPFTA